MPIPIPRALVEFILLGPTDDRRQLQDSPILGDVWIAFAENPAEVLDLLITPHKTQPAGHVAAKIADSIDRDDTDIAYLQAILAARLDFEEVLSVLVPMTEWWHEKRTRKMLEKYGRDADDRTSGASILSAKKVEATIAKVLEAARAWQLKKNSSRSRGRRSPRSIRDAGGPGSLGGNCFFAREEKTESDCDGGRSNK